MYTIVIIVIVVLIYSKIFQNQMKLYFYQLVPFVNNILQPVSFKKRKILIITTEDRKDSYIKLHDISFNNYCTKHGYHYIRSDNCPKEQATTYWCKIHKVLEYINDYDYVMWADSDTIITQKDYLIDTFISEKGEPDIIIGTDNNRVNSNGFNAGLFLIKNSPIGRSFLKECITSVAEITGCIKDGKERGIWAGSCYEQGVMNLLIRQKYHDYTYVDTTGELFWSMNTKEYNGPQGVFMHLFDIKEGLDVIFKKYI